MNLLEILKKNADNAKSYIDGLVSEKQDTLTFDTAPTEGSQNPVTSDGIQKAIAAKTVDLSNYPTKNGTGASGTWGISITGNASTATKATQDASGNIIIDTYETKANVDDFMNNCTEDEIKKLWIFIPEVVEPSAPLPPVQIIKTFDANVFRVGEKIIISNKSLQEYDGDTAFNIVYLDDTDPSNKRVLYKISNKDNFYGIEDTKYEASIDIKNPSVNYNKFFSNNYLDNASSPTVKSYEDKQLLRILLNDYPSFKKNTISRVLSSEYIDDVLTALNRFLTYIPDSSSYSEPYLTFVNNLKNNIDDNKEHTFQYISSLHEEYYTILDKLTNNNVKNNFNFMDRLNNCRDDRSDIRNYEFIANMYFAIGAQDPNFGKDEKGNYDSTKINSIPGTYLIYLIDAIIHYNHIDFDATPLAVSTISVTVTLDPV